MGIPTDGQMAIDTVIKSLEKKPNKTKGDKQTIKILKDKINEYPDITKQPSNNGSNETT